MDLILNQNIDFLLYEKGETYLLNGVSQRGLFMEVTDKISFYDDIILTSKVPFETGNTISYQDSSWLVISQVQNNNDADISIYRARIRKCNYNVNFNFEGIIKTFPTIIQGKVFDVQEGKYVFLPTGKVLVTMQENNETLAIALDQRFIKMGSAWRVTGINRTAKGIITLSCDLDLFSPDDNQLTEVADEAQYVYALSIAEAPIIDVAVGNSLQLTTSLTLNGVASDKALQYSSSDSSKVSVNSTGLVTSISSGNIIITVSMVEMPSIQATIEIDAAVVIVDNFTYELNGNLSVQTEVKLNQTQIYTAVKKNNGVVVPDATFTFSLNPGTTSPSAYQFVTINLTQASIKCLQYTYYITLRATDNLDTSQYVEKYIKLRGII